MWDKIIHTCTISETHFSFDRISKPLVELLYTKFMQNDKTNDLIYVEVIL